MTLKGPVFHHEVIVKPGGGRSDELNWNIMDSEQIVAHEFGHMLGAFDEYKGGATDPKRQSVDASSIMTSNPETGKVYPRHFEVVREWFTERTKQAVSLVSME